MSDESFTKSDSANRRRRFAIFALQAISLIPVVAFASTSFASHSWLLGLLCNFQVAIFWSVVIFAPIFLLFRCWKWATFLGLVATISGCCVGPIYLPDGKSALNDQTVKILLCNVYHGNREYQRFIDLIDQTDPDIIVIVEFTPQWQQALNRLEDSYQHRILEPKVFGAGAGVYSRIELRDTRVFRLAERDVHDCPVIRTGIRIGDRTVSLFAVHPLSPRFPEFAGIRDREILKLADLISDYQGEKIVAGDFNATPWLPVMKKFIRDTGLQDSRQGFGIQATWPQSVPLMRVPIDHVFVSEGIKVHAREVMSDVGSDHFPVLIELGPAIVD